MNPVEWSTKLKRLAKTKPGDPLDLTAMECGELALVLDRLMARITELEAPAKTNWLDSILARMRRSR